MQSLQYYCFWTTWLTLATAEQEAFRAEFTLGLGPLSLRLSLNNPLAYFAAYRHNSFWLELFQTRVQAIILLHKNLFFRSIVRQGFNQSELSIASPVTRLIYTSISGLQAHSTELTKCGSFFRTDRWNRGQAAHFCLNSRFVKGRQLYLISRI